MYKKLALPLLALFVLSSCFKKELLKNSNSNPADQTMNNLQVSPSFTFKTDKNVDVMLSTLDNSDQPVPGIRINVYSDYPENGGGLITSCFTGNDGNFHKLINVPAYTDSLVLETGAIGFVQLQKRAVVNGQLHCILGGKNPSLNGRASFPEPDMRNTSFTGRVEALAPVKALGSFNGNGVPGYLTLPNDVVDASFLTDINKALPEYQPVPTYHPQYLNATNQASLVIQQLSNVWVTFVHEGAGYKNVLCFYKYNVNNPPRTPADIDTLHAIFPNTSYVNSGGGLVSGNKVEIGTFAPGTAIGWALIANGYNGSAITSGLGAFYSNAELNPETVANLKQHCLLLNDVNRGKFLLSFEDQNRQGSCDNDFNDAIFYVTANPIQAINPTNVPLPAYSTNDQDNDGVTDNFDDYPQDPAKAFNNYYPSENAVGTLAFEDQWPSKGDYDFNDMVIDYNYNTVTNAQNQISEINAKIIVKAIGASYHSGFGVSLPINPNLIASVSGTDVRGTLIHKNPNGTEAGQSNAIIIIFDDAFNELPWPGSGIGVNTTIGAPYVQPKTLNLVIKLNTPVSVSTLGLPPYNSFIFTNRNRANEIHLINQKPTDLANRALLGTLHDNSNPAAGRYYVTAANLPFAIDIAGPFEYSIEKKVITETHLKFYNWSVSSGFQYRDWFKAGTNYRNTTNVYSH